MRMSDHPTIVVKVLVDADFYKKCLAAYNELEGKKINKANANSNDLEGRGIVYEEPTGIVPNTDIVLKSRETPTSSNANTVVTEAMAPIILPVEEEKTSLDDKYVKRSSLINEVKKLLVVHNQSDKKMKKSSPVKKPRIKKSVPSSSFKRPEGASWYYIGLKD